MRLSTFQKIKNLKLYATAFAPLRRVAPSENRRHQESKNMLVLMLGTW